MNDLIWVGVTALTAAAFGGGGLALGLAIGNRRLQDLQVEIGDMPRRTLRLFAAFNLLGIDLMQATGWQEHEEANDVINETERLRDSGVLEGFEPGADPLAELARLIGQVDEPRRPQASRQTEPSPMVNERPPWMRHLRNDANGGG